MEPSVKRTPKSLTPRLGHVRELWPLWLQCEHLRVIDNTKMNRIGRVGLVGSEDPNHMIRDKEKGVLGLGVRENWELGLLLICGLASKFFVASTSSLSDPRVS